MAILCQSILLNVASAATTSPHETVFRLAVRVIQGSNLESLFELSSFARIT